VAIERATRADERVTATTIADLPSRLAAEPPTGPVIVMIGRAFAEFVSAAAPGDVAATRSEAPSHKARA
jgi:siroheme synthase